MAGASFGAPLPIPGPFYALALTVVYPDGYTDAVLPGARRVPRSAGGHQLN